jgi:hypothetical protein
MAKAPINVAISGDYNDKDIKRAMKDLASLQKEGAKNESAFDKISKSVKGFGLSSVGATLGVVGIGAALISFTKGAEDAEIANRKLGNVLEQMGFGEATARVAAYAETLERTVAVDADVIKATQTKLATFKNLTESVNEAGGAFDRATLAALDLAAAGFGSAETNAVQLGKALQDPIKGITALARAGVTFTEQEKDKIKALVESNQTLAAQDLILQAIETQVGGTAEAGASSFDRIRLSAMQVADVIGLALLPFVESFADFLSNSLVPAITGMSTGIGSATRVISENKTAFIAATAAVAALTAAMLLNRIGGIAFAAQYAAHTVVTASYTLAANAARIATIALTTAMRAVPFIAIATAVVGLITVLDQGAKSQEKWRREQENTLRATDGLRDSTGRFTKEAVALGLASRGAHLNGERLRGTISGTAAAAIAAGNAMGSTLTPNTYAAGDAADDAAQSYYDLYRSIFQARQAASDLANTSGTVSSAIAQGFTKPFLDGVGAMASQYGKVDKAAKGASGSAGSVDKELDKLTDKKQNRMNALKELAETAKKSMSDMRESVYSTMVGWLDLGNAFDAYKGRQTLVNETLKALEDQRRTMTAESTQDQKDKLQELADAHERAKGAARDGAQSIVAEFNEQAKKFGEFGAKLQELLRAGLNKTSFMQIVNMGYERGGEVVDSYLKGNTSELVKQTNSTMAEYDKLSQSIAEESSRAFYQAGLQSALALLKAFTAALGKGGTARKEMKAIIKDLESELQINITSNVATPSGGTSSFAPVSSLSSQSGYVPFIDQNHGTGDPFAGGIPGLFGEGDAAFQAYMAALNAATPFAKGGIVTSPMLGLVGEAGPEAIIPLSRGGNSGIGSTIHLTVNAGLGTSGAEVGRQIVDALKAYERRNGSVYVAA